MFRRAQALIARLGKLAQQGLCRQLFFDESGFSSNSPITYGWALRGQAHAIKPQPHRQRVNVLGALDQDNRLTWCAIEWPMRKEDVFAFFDRLCASVGATPQLVVLDNAGINRRKAVECARRR